MLNKIADAIKDFDIEQDILYKKWDIKHRDELFTSLYWNYYPLTEKYFFEANPSFFYEYKNLFDFGRYPVSMMRDGFLGVLDFFLIHPKPHPDFGGIIIVPKKFEGLIPKSWQGKVAAYQFCNLKPSETREVIIFGLATSEVFYNRSVKEVARGISDKLSHYEIDTLMIMIRESILASEKTKKKMEFVELLREIYRHTSLDQKIHFNNEIELVKKFEGQKFDYYNFDQENVFIYDNYFEHHLSSFGGYNLSWGEPTNSGLFYKLSQNHGVEITDVHFENNYFSDFFIPFKLGGMKERSIYELFQSKKIKEIYLNQFPVAKS